MRYLLTLLLCLSNITYAVDKAEETSDKQQIEKYFSLLDLPEQIVVEILKNLNPEELAVFGKASKLCNALFKDRSLRSNSPFCVKVANEWLFFQEAIHRGLDVNLFEFNNIERVLQDQIGRAHV